MNDDESRTEGSRFVLVFSSRARDGRSFVPASGSKGELTKLYVLQRVVERWRSVSNKKES